MPTGKILYVDDVALSCYGLGIHGVIKGASYLVHVARLANDGIYMAFSLPLRYNAGERLIVEVGNRDAATAYYGSATARCREVAA